MDRRNGPMEDLYDYGSMRLIGLEIISQGGADLTALFLINGDCSSPSSQIKEGRKKSLTI